MDNNIKESNLERFQNLVYSDDLDIVCVNETWLSGHVYNAEILHSGYCIVRKDRKTRGGGVLLGIKTAVFKSVREIEHNHDLEIAMAEITTAKDMKLLICSCYRPPDADKTIGCPLISTNLHKN
jgi:exonuclease III